VAVGEDIPGRAGKLSRPVDDPADAGERPTLDVEHRHVTDGDLASLVVYSDSPDTASSSRVPSIIASH